MSGIAPGDVVVCVDESPCKCCGVALCYRRGRSYRVLATSWGRNIPTGRTLFALHLEGDVDIARHPAFRGVNADRFRKIDAADERFTQQVRACRPVQLPELVTRDSRLKPLVETGTGSIREADESGGARSAIAQPATAQPKAGS